ncbi:hypothetical protein MNEG_4162 [Monoraphidium neglectum]|uniref:RRM domain-containing protein n=1 Tax=Monoraphidium neglectum TaxID=145388 RepID=A0A0D2LAH4_9CHLO|nr:hypothetical protein MNEG_4162 [Monoraphidium neglectum]KIZ03794.1 hypothetical protein MNEG_4162 [Monoraphidium neglectum]|eukprot:XP_013902813.1 hypothetical protein MNEG_4162 [Monoraphidium neglectum]
MICRQNRGCATYAGKSVGLLRALHIEGLPLTMTASKLSELMTAYGPVQYAEAAPEVAKDEGGSVTGRRLHCYVVFADHTGACMAKRALQPRMPDSPCTPASLAGAACARAGGGGPPLDGPALAAALGGRAGAAAQADPAGDALAPRWCGLTPRASSAPSDALSLTPLALTPRAGSAADGSPRPQSELGADDAAAGGTDAEPSGAFDQHSKDSSAAPPAAASAKETMLPQHSDEACRGQEGDQQQQQQPNSPPSSPAPDAAQSPLADAAASSPEPPLGAPGDRPPSSPAAAAAAAAPPPPPLALPALPVLRVRFAKPQNVAAACTPAFRAFVAAQWAQASAAAKACPDISRKPGCKVNALFISKLHQHITSARLQGVFGKFGRMIACEVQYHSDGRSAGHGVVIYETIEDAERALRALNGYRLEGRALEITPLRLKKLPSKLEHLKHRIKRLPGAPGDGGCGGGGGGQSCSEDGGGGFGGFGGLGPGGGTGVGSGQGALGLSRALSASPRVSGAGGAPAPLGAAALSAHMAAAAAAAAASVGGGGFAGGDAMQALNAMAFAQGAYRHAGLGALGGFGAAQQQAMAAATAAAAASIQQQQQQQNLSDALAAAHGMHPAAAAALLHSLGPGGPAPAPAPVPDAAELHAHAQAALLQQHYASQRALAAAAAAGLTPQQVLELAATLGSGGFDPSYHGGTGAIGGHAPGGLLPASMGLPHPHFPGLLPGGAPSSAPPPGLDLSFL